MAFRPPPGACRRGLRVGTIVIQNFLRLPRGAAEITADLLRVLGVVSIVVAAIGWNATDAGIMAAALPALVLPRFVGVRPAVDIVYGVTVLAAAWSNVFDLYRSAPGWDTVMHVVCTAMLAGVVYLALERLGVVAPVGPGRRRRSALVLVPTIGLALSALWEMVEWIGYRLITDEIFVTYDDTIGDMAAGGLGALVAGFLMTVVSWDRSARPRNPAG